AISDSQVMDSRSFGDDHAAYFVSQNEWRLISALRMRVLQRDHTGRLMLARLGPAQRGGKHAQADLIRSWPRWSRHPSDSDSSGPIIDRGFHPPDRSHRYSPFTK